MTLFFPDLNVWLALSDSEHEHSTEAWKWLNGLPPDGRLIFSRYTQIGLLRLLVTPSVMGNATLTLGKAWGVYDRWLQDPRLEFHPEPRAIDETFRQITLPFASQRASKAVGDCWLLAYAAALRASLVTFDRALHQLARTQHQSAIIPG